MYGSYPAKALVLQALEVAKPAIKVAQLGIGLQPALKERKFVGWLTQPAIYIYTYTDVRNDFRIFLFQFLRHVNLQYFAYIYSKLLLGTMMTDSELNITIT